VTDTIFKKVKRPQGPPRGPPPPPPPPPRLRRENEALKGLLLELAADRQAAQARLAELQQKMADIATTSIGGEVRLYEGREGGKREWLMRFVG